MQTETNPFVFNRTGTESWPHLAQHKHCRSCLSSSSILNQNNVSKTEFCHSDYIELQTDSLSRHLLGIYYMLDIVLLVENRKQVICSP